LIGLTGATGQLGGRVARRLAAAGVPQRLVLRDPGRAPVLELADVAQASYGDKPALLNALDGVETLLLVSASESADRISLHKATVDAAVAAGVRRIVYTSFLAAGPDATFTFARDHWHTRDDVADVAARVLVEDSHAGQTYDLTGPAAFTLAEAAEQLGTALGRPIRYEAETLDEAYRSRERYGAPPWEVAGWVTTYAAIASGELAAVSGAVQDITGHPPVGLADYFGAGLHGFPAGG
jgi:NAD(P)H dehydrogenase (quinone)